MSFSCSHLRVCGFYFHTIVNINIGSSGKCRFSFFQWWRNYSFPVNVIMRGVYYSFHFGLEWTSFFLWFCRLWKSSTRYLSQFVGWKLWSCWVSPLQTFILILSLHNPSLKCPDGRKILTDTFQACIRDPGKPSCNLGKLASHLKKKYTEKIVRHIKIGINRHFSKY